MNICSNSQIALQLHSFSTSQLLWRSPPTFSIVISSGDNKPFNIPSSECKAAPVEAAGTWRQAIGPWQWSFPRDHGAHPAYRTEWWYFTGNLKDKDGKQYGYQLTFFRQGLTLTASQPDNPWSIRDVYLAHFALVDGSSGKFWYHDRATRTGPGLAGARTGSMDVWTLNWSGKMIGNTIYLKAHLDEMALDLELFATKAKDFSRRKGFEYERLKPRPGIILLFLHRSRFKRNNPDLPITEAHRCDGNELV